MTREIVCLTGHLHLSIATTAGQSRVCEATNSVVDGGRRLLAQLLAGGAQGPTFQMVVGTDGAPTTPDLIKLLNTDGLDPVPVAERQAADGSVKLKATFPAFDRNLVISEAGLMLTCNVDGQPVSALYNRAQVRPGQAVQKGEVLTLTWTLSFAPVQAPGV